MHPAEQLAAPAVGDLAAVLDAVLLEILDELGIVDADGDERLGPCRPSAFNWPWMRSSATVTSWTLPSRTRALNSL